MADTTSPQHPMPARRKTLLAAALAALVAVAAVVAASQEQAPYRHATGTIFGTVYNVKYQSHDNLDGEIRRRLEEVDASLSTFNPHSTISAINRGEARRADTMFAAVFAKAMEVSRQTGGAFDITVAPLVNLWGFGFKGGSEPTPKAIDSLLRLTGYEKVAMRDGRVVKADPRIMLDCSAIAKGYGSDMAAGVLRSRGVENFMVEIGGEVVTSGVSQKRTPWKIGVTKPVDDPTASGGELQAVLNVTDKAMATSGNYRNYYYRDGKKYAHTIDPHTGYPVQHNILSATVLADDCATADAYATAFMVMGLDKAKEVLRRHPELTAYFICSAPNGKFSVWCSPSLADKMQ